MMIELMAGTYPVNLRAYLLVDFQVRSTGVVCGGEPNGRSDKYSLEKELKLFYQGATGA